MDHVGIDMHERESQSWPWRMSTDHSRPCSSAATETALPLAAARRSCQWRAIGVAAGCSWADAGRALAPSMQASAKLGRRKISFTIYLESRR